MKHYALLIMILFIVLISGCANAELNKFIETAKKDSQVQDFLKTYPDAKFNGQYISIDKAKEACGKDVPEKRYFLLEVKHTDIIQLKVYLDIEANKVICASMKGSIFEERIASTIGKKEILNRSRQKPRQSPDYHLDMRIDKAWGGFTPKAGYEHSDFYFDIKAMENILFSTKNCNSMKYLYDGVKDKSVEEPEINNPNLREACIKIAGAIDKKEDFLRWFDDYFGVTFNETEADLRYVGEAFSTYKLATTEPEPPFSSDVSLICKEIYDPDLRNGCTLWVKEYNGSYDLWYETYFLKRIG